MVTKSPAKAKVNGVKGAKGAKDEKGAKKSAAKEPKVKSKPKVLSGLLEVEIDPARAEALARLYAWLAADLAEWQAKANNGAGEETEGDCPVIVQIHNEACRKLDRQIIDLPTATDVATTILKTNTQNKSYTDRITQEPFEFLQPEIQALTCLTMNETFVALAPYIPLGELEMW